CAQLVRGNKSAASAIGRTRLDTLIHTRDLLPINIFPPTLSILQLTSLAKTYHEWYSCARLFSMRQIVLIGKKESTAQGAGGADLAKLERRITVAAAVRRTS